MVMPRRPKLLATAISLLGVAAIAAAFWASKDWLHEEWWIHKLETGDVEERTRAAMRLGKLQSSRAVPHLLRVIGESSQMGGIALTLAYPDKTTLKTSFSIHGDEKSADLCMTCMKSIYEMTPTPRLESSLVEALQDASAVVRVTACDRLARMPGLSEEALLALRELLSDSDPAVRKIAGKALERIQSR